MKKAMGISYYLKIKNLAESEFQMMQITEHKFKQKIKKQQ